MIIPLQAIPDPTVFLRYGTVGVLLLIVLILVTVGASTVVKIATAYIARHGNGNGLKTGRTATEQALALRELQNQRNDAQRQLDELKAGNKPVQFWLDAYDASAVKASAPMLRNQETMLLLMRELLESQRRIRVRLKMDDDEG